MALTQFVESSTIGMEIRSKEYPNGQILMFAPVGSTQKTDTIFACGAKKLAKLFGYDKDNDLVLLTVMNWLETQLTVEEYNRLKNNMKEFHNMLFKE